MAEDVPDVYVRFEGIDGECTDEMHPGKQEPGGHYPDGVKFGWFQIKSFSFSFSVKETGDATSDAQRAQARQQTRAGGGTGTSGASGAPPGTTPVAIPAAVHPAAGTTDTGPFDHPDISISKNLDVATVTIWQDKCNAGKVIPKVELEACRSGGIPGSPKIPFVRLIFAEVYVKSVSLSISADSMPAETLQFSYERVKIESVWTDNETGERKVSNPRRFGWDFHNNKQWAGEA